MNMGFLVWILVGLVAGWLAGQVMKGGGYGVLVDIILGIVGGLLGGWLFGFLGIWRGGGMIGSVIVAFIGAVILIWITRLLKRGWITRQQPDRRDLAYIDPGELVPMAASGIAIVPSDLRPPQFLDGLHPPHRKVILSAAASRRYTTNSVVTNQGHPAEHLFLIAKGRARHFFVTEDGKKFLLRWLGPGDCFGGRTILSSRDRVTIRSLVDMFPRLLENALLTASDYVAWHLTAHIRIARYTARQRVAQVLVTLARTMGQKVSGGFILDITNEELANAANVTPFTASRMISDWQRSGVLRKRRGKVWLRSPEQLFLGKA
jgi:uncharacterized membrane protein YeaQ/YmgE (transglycosylase-associated protein family)/CRP-like cAMP-binding protein